MEEKKLFLLDAYALIYRAYYGLIRSPRVTSKGFNTSAIFGFCNTLEEVLRKENPGYIAVCFDPAGGHTFRHEEYPDYKAQRDKQPEDITLSIPYIKRILAAYGIQAIEVAGYEADDVIGTLSRMAQRDGFTTCMMTLDKDYGQLVSDRVLMYRPALKGAGFEIRGPKEVCEKYGIDTPSQIIDLLALEGDASDNIPGCPGVGEKTAVKLIREWGSIDNLLAHTADLKGSLQQKIADNADQIRFSRRLVTICTDVPINTQPADLRRPEPDVNALVEIFNELEFKTMVQRLGGRLSTPPAPQALGSLFADEDIDTGEAPAADTPQPMLKQIDIQPSMPSTAEEIADVCRRAIQAGNIGLCVEAPGEEAMRAPLLGVALAWGDDCSAYIQMPDFEGEREEVIQLLQPLLDNPAVTLFSHDVKRDMVLLRRANLTWGAAWQDSSVAHYLLSPEMKHDLPTIAFAFLGHKTLDYELTATERKKVRPRSPEESAVASAERALLALRLMPLLRAALEKENLAGLYDTIENPFIAVLASMELAGVRIDTAVLRQLSDKLTARLNALEQEAYSLAGGQFNISSPMQVGELLFGKLGIDTAGKVKRTSRGGWSTTEETLEKFKDHRIVALILEIRGLRKLLATYIDALPGLINPSTGKLHTTFNQTGTATGRISSTNPNLQNIPIRTDDGREIRRAFIADPGDLILSADYSQIELRLIADFSGDPDMTDAFNSDEDIHRATAAKIYHTPLAEVTDSQRRHAKTANFGIIYGISAFGLSERLGISRAEAKELMAGYKATYPRLQAYMDDCVAKARRDGFVTTVMGRKRFLPEISSRNAALRGYAERNAVNAPLQGSAADIIKKAMIDIDREMQARQMRSRMILQVHDELIFNVVPDELAQLQELVVNKMENAYRGRVKLEVSCGVASNWLEAH